MKFFSFRKDNAYPESARGIISNILIILAAVFSAVFIWYFVSKGRYIETQIEQWVDYKNIPDKLIVIEGLVNKITIRLSGPERLLKSISRDRFDSRTIDLSKIKKGENLIPFITEKLEGPYRAFKVVDISPSKLELKVDEERERTVPIAAKVESPFEGNGLTFSSINVNPGQVKIIGPEKKISDLNEIKVYIRPNANTSGTEQVEYVKLDTPNLVTADPPIVKVTYTITSGRKVISRKYQINIEDDTQHVYIVKPSEVEVMVEVPDALSRNTKYLNQLSLEVVPPPQLKDGESKSLKVRMRIPEGMTVLSHQQMEVVLTKKEILEKKSN